MIEYFCENLWQFWALIGVLCLILELTSGDLFILCFGIGGLLTAVLSPIIPSFYVQIAVFVVGTLLSIYLVRPVALRWLHRNEPNRASNADALMGRVGTVSQAIQQDGYGRVAIDGDDWKAVSATGEAVAAGEKVTVVGRESIIITVEKTNP